MKNSSPTPPAPEHTPLERAQYMEEALGFKRIYIKDESHNPTGTFKDRRSAAIVKQAVAEGYRNLVLISAGNAAYSLAQYACPLGMEINVVVDTNLNPSIKHIIRQMCNKIVEVDLGADVLSSEDLISLVRSSTRERILDVTNGYHDSYRSIVCELRRQLPEAPDAIYMPFGGGEAMTGVLNGVTEQGWHQDTAVYGIHHMTAERLRTNYIHKDHLKCFAHNADDPEHAVYGVSSPPMPDQIQYLCLPEGVRAEEASAYMFHHVIEHARQIKARGHRRIVLINSGYGRVIEEAKSV